MAIATPSRLARAAVLSCFVAGALASPTPVEREAVTPAAVVERATSSSISNQNQLNDAIGSFSADFKSLEAAASVGAAIFTNIVPAPGPTAIPQAMKEFETVASADPGDIFKSGYEILLNGFAGGDYVDIAQGYLTESSTNNFNPIPPRNVIYPKADPNDAPYDLTESQLRQVIYIPPDFTYGRIPPVLLFPGTGVEAGQNFAPNYGKLLKQQKIADPVYVNTPRMTLIDIQTAAEYSAYAVNYISSICGGKNVRTHPHKPSYSSQS